MHPATYINYNGNISLSPDCNIPTDNAAFRYGYGIFETMLIKDGTIRLGAYHFDRLFQSLSILRLDKSQTLTAEKLEKEILRTATCNGLNHLCRVRMQLFAGSEGRYGTRSETPYYLIECYPVEDSHLHLNPKGLTAGIATGISKNPDQFSNLKTCNALIYAYATIKANECNWDEALICNTNGNIIETTIANIFWIKDSILYTPPLSEGCVAGVMRRHICNMIPGIKEQPLPPDALLSADEVFTTNAIRGIQWISNIEFSTYGNKQILKLNDHYLKLIP